MNLQIKTLIFIFLLQGIVRPLGEGINHDPYLPASPFENKNIISEKLKELYASEPCVKEDMLDAFKPAQATTDDRRYTYTYNSSNYLSGKLYEVFVSGSWIVQGRDVFTYDEGKLSELLYEKYISGNWQNGTKTTWEYNEGGQVLLEQFETWSNNTWNIFSKLMISYNPDGSISTNTFEQWDNNIIVAGARSTFTYNSNGWVTEELVERFFNNYWQNHFRHTYSYDVNKYIKLTESWLLSGTWENEARSIDSLNVNRQVISSIIQSWTGTEWYNQARYLYGYDDLNGLLIDYIYQVFWENDWLDQQRQVFHYNLYLKLIEKLELEWVIGWQYLSKYTATYDTYKLVDDVLLVWENNGWENYTAHAYTYDNDGNAIRGDSFKWEAHEWVPADDELAMWYNAGSQSLSFYEKWVDVSYNFFTGVSEQEEEKISFELKENYPNPFNPSTTISYSVPEVSQVQLKIYDISGSEVEVLMDEIKPSGHYNIVWNASGFPSGVYFIRFTAQASGGNQRDVFTAVNKMILIK
jgi:hypothetical protein